MRNVHQVQPVSLIFDVAFGNLLHTSASQIYNVSESRKTSLQSRALFLKSLILERSGSPVEKTHANGERDEFRY